MLGAPHIGGPSVNQACATSARVLQMAAQEVTAGDAKCALLITADKLSNGPHLYFPQPGGPGGTGGHEDWVLDNFSNDPYAHCAMIQTAENVAKNMASAPPNNMRSYCIATGSMTRPAQAAAPSITGS